MDRRSLSVAEDKIDIVLPDSEVPLASLAAYLRDVFGSGMDRVTGELIGDDGAVTLQLRNSSKGALPVSNAVPLARLQDSLKAGAEQVLRVTEPYILASSFYQDDKSQALAEVQRIISDLPESDTNVTRAYNLWGLILADKKDYSKAMEKFQRALALSSVPESEFVHLNIGNLQSSMKDTDGAIASYRKAIQIDPNSVGAHLGLGHALRARDDIDGAIASYKKALEIDPKFVFAYNGLGNVLVDKKDLDGAIKSYQRAIEIDPSYAYAYTGLGNAYRFADRLDEAMANYLEAIEHDPKYAGAYYNAASLLYDRSDAKGEQRRKNLGSACTYLQEGHSVSPDDEDFSRLADRINLELAVSGLRCDLH
jgi:tetratricopeptide (TPR) repeat protein